MNPLSWISWLFSFFTRARALPTAKLAAPPKVVSVLHAILDEVQKHEGGHPILYAATEWLDELVEERGEEFLTAIERAALAALAVKYPILAPLVLAAARPAANEVPPG